MGSRAALAAKLAEVLPKTFKIVPVPRNVDQIEAGHPLVMFIRESIKRAGNGIGSYAETYVLWIVEPKTIQPEAEDGLDVLLDEVIVALDDLPWLLWEKASRAIFGDQETGQPAYRIDITLTSNKGSNNP